MLDELLRRYEEKGVSFITVEQASKDSFYFADPGVAAKWGSELQYQVMKSKDLKLKDLGLTKYENYPAKKLETICR